MINILLYIMYTTYRLPPTLRVMIDCGNCAVLPFGIESTFLAIASFRFRILSLMRFYWDLFVMCSINRSASADAVIIFLT